MAVRPIFIPRAERGPLVEELPVSINWHGGFSVSQKQKNIAELHSKARELGIYPVLEISTKSPLEVGKRLSAFNLKIEVGGAMKSLESVYQSSKVFEHSGQHEILMDLDPFKAKKEIRRLGQGRIICFRFLGQEFPTEPVNAFYDWLYIRAIVPHEKWIRANLHFAAYSDIEFTPSKSVNCQGRAVAEFHALSMRGKAAECVHDFDVFRRLLMYAQRHG
ncbi:DarT1-associated NADAR antitoxin family protein [Phaeobacter gallaeciensis]|uniref:DarT1-associated NADAR antitoxin family protein n=1 Tax=Phaeobacter gallaeciensis TaxID=60890 RepID=UPI0008029C19